MRRAKSVTCGYGILVLLAGCARFAGGGDGGNVGVGTEDGGRGQDVGVGASDRAPRGGSGGVVGGSGGSGGSGPTADANCGLTTFKLERVPPDVLIILDRSASMMDLAKGLLGCILLQCNSKWTDMKNALTANVTATDATLNWGLKLFPTDDHCGVADVVAAPVAPNNAAAVNGAINGSRPGGRTPTRFAVEGGGRYLMSLTTPNPRYIVLATDGLPNCGGTADDDSDDEAAIAAVATVAAAGIPVFVIGVGTAGDGDATLSAMAKAGGKPRMADPAYYPVTTAADITAALATIGGQIVSCTLPIKNPPDPTNIAVDADGMRVPRSATNGWEYAANMTTIQLSGSWCTNYQNGTIKNVQTIFGCPGVIIP